VTGGGSGVGIAALLNGRTDVANASREMNAYEYRMASQRGLDVEPFIFATDALALIVHPAVNIDSLDLNALGKIFSGNIRDWSQVGGAGGPISLYGRQSNSGTFMYFREHVVGRDFSPALKQMNGNAQILEAVRNDPNAIGYVGLGYLTDSEGHLRAGIRVIKLSIKKGDPAVSPLDRQSILEGRYPLTRPLYHYTDGIPAEKTRAFFEFEKSEAGTKIIVENGYLPASEQELASKQQQ
ncbi:MAG: phosphate ABC transporter substrate-binding protein, partial [Saprospiraceae bacterium]|nr:phosphate ABC transporter substrate-binding protein [Saprospiraceae bacterium]